MRDSFVFHIEHRELLQMLPPEQQLVIYDFLSDFAKSDGTASLPEMDTAAQIVLKVITQRMLSDFQRYDEIKQKRAAGGKMGGRPKKEPKGLEENLMVSEEPQGYFGNLSEAKKPVSVPVSVSVSVPVSDSGSVCEIEGVSREGNAHTPQTLEAVKARYMQLCKEHHVTPIQGEPERFLTYHHNYWESELEQWVSQDVAKGKYRTATKVINKSGLVNFEQPDPQIYEDVFYKVLQANYRNQEKQEVNELEFESV